MFVFLVGGMFFGLMGPLLLLIDFIYFYIIILMQTVCLN